MAAEGCEDRFVMAVLLLREAGSRVAPEVAFVSRRGYPA